MTLNRSPLVTSLVAAAFIVAAPMAAHADDLDPEKPTGSAAKDSAEPKPTADGETDPLLRKLIGDAVVDAENGDPLTAAAELMERAGRRIGDERDSGAETRDLQQRAIDDLEKLIELAKQQQQQQQANRQSDPGEGQPMPMGDQPEGMPDEGEEGGEERMASSSGDDGPRRDDDEASESTAATEAARDREAALAERRRLVKDVWGHLPPTMREELLNAYSDRPLPKYDELVRAYFRALAERTNEEEG